MSKPVSGGCAALAIVALGVGGGGCTRLQVLNYTNAQGLAKEVMPGAKLRIVMTDGKTHRLRATGVEAGTISGVESGRGVKIPLDDVREIDRHVPAPGKTAALFGVLAGELIHIRHCNLSIWADGTCNLLPEP